MILKMIHSSVNYIESHMNAERKTGKNRKKQKETQHKQRLQHQRTPTQALIQPWQQALGRAMVTTGA